MKYLYKKSLGISEDKIPFNLLYIKTKTNHFFICTMMIIVLFSIPNVLKAQNTWADKLGFPQGKKVLLLHMDDAGMCSEANAAVESYIENGHLSSAAVMMPCVNAKSMIEWANAHPAADIGVHLTLTSEWKTYRWGPVSDPTIVAGLVDPDGKFYHEVPEVVMHASAKEVEIEIRAQIEKSIALGPRPTHIDTHMGTLYGSAEYVKVFLKVAEEYHIPANVIDLSVPEVAGKFKQQGYLSLIHISEPTRLGMISYAVFCLKKKK